MEKLKKLLINASTLLKTVYKRFPITMVIIYLVTMIFVFGTEDFIDKLFDGEWMAMFAIATLGIVLVETWSENKIIKTIGTIISFMIALVFRTFFEAELTDEINEFLNKILVTYISIVSLLTIYKTIKNANVKVEEYFLKAFANWGRITFLYILANLGMSVVIGAFQALILDGEDLEFISKLFVILFGCYYVPSLLHSATDMTQERGKIIKALVLYVSTPVTGFLLLIFYMYLAKITLAGKIFENEMFSILSLGYAVGMPIALLLKNYDTSGKISKLSKIFILAFIPIIALQFIAMTLRVNQYGLTSERYMGYILILFEIVLTTLSLYKDGIHLDKIFLILIGFVIVFLHTPINYIDYPDVNQANRLEKMVENGFENLSKEEKKEAKTVYVYLKRSNKQELIEKTISENVIREIEEYEYDYYYDEYTDDYYSSNYDEEYDDGIEIEETSIFADAPFDGLDISNYSKIYRIARYYNQEDEDYKKVEVKSREKEVVVEVDFTRFLDGLIKSDYTNTEDEYLEENGILKSNNENIDVFINDCNIDYEIYNEKILSLDFDGYILVK